MKPKTLLFATDLSSRSDRGLDRSVDLAARWQARLVVAHALQEPAPVGLGSRRLPPDPKTTAIDQVRGDLRGAGDIDLDVVVERGEPASVILGLAESLGCDLIITGVARNETLGRFLLGSTVEKLTRNTELPVLVVKSRPNGLYRKIVVATDFSDGSRRALEAALDLFPEAQITLFHAFEVPFKGIVDDRHAAQEAAAQNALSEGRAFLAATPAAASSVHPIAVVCEYGEVGMLLRDYVGARGIDLVVMGTQGKGLLSQVILGSVAQCLLEVVPVDMLVVRRPKA